MRIDHIALWTNQLEELKDFYTSHFAATAGVRYNNLENGFSSYFLSFAGGARLELMYMPGIRPRYRSREHQDSGLIHMAFSTGSENAVDELTAKLAALGYACLEAAHHTGDGYYESTVMDPDGNRIEITV